MPIMPLEEKIQGYLRLLDEGWGLSYARNQVGLRMSSPDYKRSLKDPRIVAAHQKRAEENIAKHRSNLWQW